MTQAASTSNSHQPHHSLLDQVYYELSIFIGMFIMVFGILLASGSMVKKDAENHSARSFTDISSAKAGSQITEGIAGLANDYLFELGYTGDADILANLFYSFVGIDTNEAIDYEPLYTAEREKFVEEGVVLGVQEHN